MKLCDAAIKLVKDKEGLQLTAYPDISSDLGKACKAKGISIYSNKYRQLQGWEKLNGSPWTIGYGATRDAKENQVRPGDTWTQAQCEELLLATLEAVGTTVLKKIKVPLSQNQYSALCVLCYNTGFTPLEKSVGTKLNAKDYQGAADAMLAYNKAGNPLQEMPGLSLRRKEERALFLTPDAQQSKLFAAPSVAKGSKPETSSLLPKGPSEEDITKMLDDVEKKVLS